MLRKLVKKLEGIAAVRLTTIKCESLPNFLLDCIFRSNEFSRRIIPLEFPYSVDNFEVSRSK